MIKYEHGITRQMYILYKNVYDVLRFHLIEFTLHLEITLLKLGYFILINVFQDLWSSGGTCKKHVYVCFLVA